MQALQQNLPYLPAQILVRILRYEEVVVEVGVGEVIRVEEATRKDRIKEDRKAAVEDQLHHYHLNE